MQTKLVSDFPDALLSLIEAVKLCYHPPPEIATRRGRKPDFSALSFLLLAVVAVVTKTFSDSELHRLLERDAELRTALEFSRVPHRTRILRRLKSLREAAEEQVSLFGKTILAEVSPVETQSVSATDGRMYQALGPKWHKKHRLENVIPTGLRNVDTESKWSKSGYRGWVQGYRLVLQTLVFPEPVPLFAVWRENQLNEAKIALAELGKGRLQVTDVMLGDTSFGKEDFRPAYQKAGGYVLTPLQLPKKNRSWKNDLYDYRKETIELLFQRIIQAFDIKSCPVKGEAKNGALVLAAVWIYQICWLNNYRAKKNPANVKEQIENARWRIKL
jgi:hypothetical protein